MKTQIKEEKSQIRNILSWTENLNSQPHFLPLDNLFNFVKIFQISSNIQNVVQSTLSFLFSKKIFEKIVSNENFELIDEPNQEKPMLNKSDDLIETDFQKSKSLLNTLIAESKDLNPSNSTNLIENLMVFKNFGNSLMNLAPELNYKNCNEILLTKNSFRIVHLISAKSLTTLQYKMNITNPNNRKSLGYGENRSERSQGGKIKSENVATERVIQMDSEDQEVREIKIENSQDRLRVSNKKNEPYSFSNNNNYESEESNLFGKIELTTYQNALCNLMTWDVSPKSSIFNLFGENLSVLFASILTISKYSKFGESSSSKNVLRSRPGLESVVKKLIGEFASFEKQEHGNDINNFQIIEEFQPDLNSRNQDLNESSSEEDPLIRQIRNSLKEILLNNQTPDSLYYSNILKFCCENVSFIPSILIKYNLRMNNYLNYYE